MLAIEATNLTKGYSFVGIDSNTPSLYESGSDKRKAGFRYYTKETIVRYLKLATMRSLLELMT